MARILYGAAVTAINGSIGGTTFQRNRYGSTVKNKPVTVNPNSLYVNPKKLLMQTAATEWRKLTQIQRDTWNNWATTNPTPTRLDPNSFLNGFNLFVKYHLIRWTAGGNVVLTNPDFVLQTLNNITLSVQNIGTDLRWTLNQTVTSPDWIGLLFSSGPLPQSQYITSNPTRYMANNPIGFGANFFTVGQPYIDKFGLLAPVGSFITTDLTFYRTTSPQIVESIPFRLQVA